MVCSAGGHCTEAGQRAAPHFRGGTHRNPGGRGRGATVQVGVSAADQPPESGRRGGDVDVLPVVPAKDRASNPRVFASLRRAATLVRDGVPRGLVREGRAMTGAKGKGGWREATFEGAPRFAERFMRIDELREYDDDADTAPALEPIAGTPAAGRVEALKAASADRLHLLGQVVEVLDLVHRCGVAHRNVKPCKVIVTPDLRAVLIGFGQARAGEAETTEEGRIVGTPLFMSPEILRGEVATPASDLYAVGVMLFELLTGRWPFGFDVRETLVLKLQGPAPAPSSVAPRVEPDLDRLCADLLDRDPAKRPTAAEILRVLRASSSQRRS
jgi:hypothetical protein